MTDTATLRSRLDAVPELRALARSPRGTLAGVPSGATGLLAWWLRETTGRSVLVLSPEAETLWSDTSVWAGDAALALFPAADTLPFDRVAPGEEVTRHRLATLATLAGEVPAIVIAAPGGLVRPTLPPERVRRGLALRRGERIPMEAVVERLVSLGYRREPAVSVPGEFSVRGGIVDAFGPDRNRPWRAEWFGDEVEGLRAFDVGTQTSVAQLDAVTVPPARELDLSPESVARALAAVGALDLDRTRPEIRDDWVRDLDRLGAGAYGEGIDLFTPYLQQDPPVTLLDHLDGPITLVAGGRERWRRAVSRYLTEAEGLRAQEEQRGELPGGARSGLLDEDAADALLDRLGVVELVREAAEDGAADLGWTGADSFVGRFDALAVELRRRQEAGRCQLVLSRQEHRVAELAAEQGLDPVAAEEEPAAIALLDGSLVSTHGDLSQGFSTGAAGLDVLTDAELFGTLKRRGSRLARGQRRVESTSARGARRASSGSAAREAFVIPFQPGDLVVHQDHGIGRFVEMRRVEDDGGEHEYMTVEYAEGDKLYVPVAHLDRVDRYVGGAEGRPQLSRLGGGEWERTKRRVKERTEEVARELLALYSRRESTQANPLPPDGAWQQELEAAFPYQETPDQEMVLEEIKRDMESSRPMDRVVCGDVGFGKTELAMRAAFKAAADGRQVAMLVPTTVLAQQHYSTFSSRLAPFPITVRQLSRFCTPEEVTDTLAGLHSGGVDIVIGTHRLISRDVQFRNLGLVIIDEEQRFGVLQKERFKQLRVAVDVLSLSATPIPRTLHMSLAGIRDLSVIQTPPEERQPIKTFVTAHEEGLIREVITRELASGGQVYYVHNRVRGIERVAEQLRELLPEVRIAVGHGQMPERSLAEVMQQFMDGEVDVLLCTTIIESGLDIPNANTILIDDAQRLGLAQLYQLRGRVGRAGQRAYAYVIYPPSKSLTERADKRLEVIGDLQDLGAGFRLALRDLEIRGAGNLLGEEQHGEIAAVGLELYNHLLRDAVTRMQGRQIVESPAQVTVSLPLAAHLPPSYVSDERLRLRCYQDLAAAATEQELEIRGRGLADRFGPPPAPAEALLLTLRVRLLAAAAGALGVERDGEAVVVRLPVGHGLDLPAVAAQFRGVTSSPTRLRVPTGRRPGEPQWEDVLVRALRELGRLERIRQRAAS
ncbi:MAG TPA: transcription-repair coupling factor [Candidatus Dormibacteraeota bacterium]|nr:transcription-repair coupling factor [Candidatus Dormibacteraeota bacterium]